MASMHPSDSLNVARTDCLPLKSDVNVLGNEIPFAWSFLSFWFIFPPDRYVEHFITLF